MLDWHTCQMCYPLEIKLLLLYKLIKLYLRITASSEGFLQIFPPRFGTSKTIRKWTASSEFGTYRLCEQRWFRRACASAQSRQNLRCSLIQAVSQEEPSGRRPDSWPLSMAGHAQLKFVMTECSKTQIRLTGLKWAKTVVYFTVIAKGR